MTRPSPSNYKSKGETTMKCVKCKCIVEDAFLGNICAACTNEEFHLWEAKRDEAPYLHLLSALMSEQEMITFRIITEGDAEYLVAASNRDEAIQLYEEESYIPGDAFTEVATCVKLVTVVVSLLKSNLREAERLLLLWRDEDLY